MTVEWHELHALSTTRRHDFLSKKIAWLNRIVPSYSRKRIPFCRNFALAQIILTLIRTPCQNERPTKRVPALDGHCVDSPLRAQCRRLHFCRICKVQRRAPRNLQPGRLQHCLHKIRLFRSWRLIELENIDSLLEERWGGGSTIVKFIFLFIGADFKLIHFINTTRPFSLHCAYH